jgi:hypothetical protein
MSETKRLSPAEAREAVRLLLAREHSWADVGRPLEVARRALDHLDHLRYTLRAWEEAMPLRDLGEQAIRGEYAGRVRAQLERDTARAAWAEANPCPAAGGADAVSRWCREREAVLSATLRQYDAACAAAVEAARLGMIEARRLEVEAKCRILLEMLPAEGP